MQRSASSSMRQSGSCCGRSECTTRVGPGRSRPGHSVHKRKRMDHLPTVVGLGEILWDLLPSGRQLGGAPANFAYCAHLLGNRAVVAGRVGSDDLGTEARDALLRSGLTDQFLQMDPEHPTGTVHVQLGAAGQPKFEIADGVAW